MKKTNNTPRKASLNNSQILESVRQYAIKKPLQADFTAKIVELLKALLHAQNIDTHLIESRTKDLDSFKEKISRVSKKYLHPLKDITDLSGIRIIVYYEEDLNKISELIGKEFEVDWNNSIDKRKILKPEEFGYQSIHYVVTLSKSRRSLLEWHQLSDLRAEIQVRTVLQHAWAAISHKLQYKREEDVPQELRRRLFRLSALLELADEEFMGLRDETASLTQIIEEKLAEGETDLEINILTVEEFLNTSPEVKQLVEDARKAGFSFDAYDSRREREEGLSALIALCNFVGLKVISDLKAALKKSLEWSDAYLSKQMESTVGWWSITDDFVCMLILIKVFREKVNTPYLINEGWAKSVAARVVEVASE